MLHRCTEAQCPHFGQRTDRGCKCHRTDEQVLRDALEQIEGRVEEASGLVHDSQRWHEEYGLKGELSLWDWIFAPARAVIREGGDV